MKTIFEQQGVKYRQAGDYMFPNVELDKQKEYQIGVWGQRYKRYLKSNQSSSLLQLFDFGQDV